MSGIEVSSCERRLRDAVLDLRASAAARPQPGMTALWFATVMHLAIPMTGKKCSGRSNPIEGGANMITPFTIETASLYRPGL